MAGGEMSAAKFGASLKDVLWSAQGGRCWICDRQMHRRGSNDQASASIDHIWPKAKYGDIGDIGVTLLACRSCNASRGSPQPSDADVRALIRIWRAVDRRWLRWNLKMIEADLKTMEVRRARVELLKMLEAA
jgi:hypothetical protein